MKKFVKNIYELMLGYGIYKDARWHNQLIKRLQKQINLNHIAAVEDPDWHQSSEGIWKERPAKNMKEYLREYKLVYDIKPRIKITDEIRKAAKALEPVVQGNHWDKLYQNKNIVPTRDRKYTKGVFRRANIKNENDKDG